MQPNYNPSSQGPGRPYAKWKRVFLARLPTNVRDRLNGDVVIPDLVAKKDQIQEFQLRIDQFCTRVQNNEVISAEDMRSHEITLGLMNDTRSQLKTMEEEVNKITAAGDLVLQVMRETTAGPALQAIMEGFAGAANKQADSGSEDIGRGIQDVERETRTVLASFIGCGLRDNIIIISSRRHRQPPDCRQRAQPVHTD